MMGVDDEGEMGGIVAEGAGVFAPLPPIAETIEAVTRVSEPVAPPIAAEPAPPTLPREITPEGFELDGWGLPLVGPVRVAMLAQIGRTDPNLDPTGWERVPAPAAPQE